MHDDGSSEPATDHDLSEHLLRVTRAFRADSGTIHVLRDDGLLHLLTATAGLPQSVLATITTIPVGKGMAGLAVERGRPVDTCNIQTDTTGDVKPGAKATGLSGAIVVPIFRGDEIVGTLGIGNRGERTFTAAEAQELIDAGRRLAAFPGFATGALSARP